MAASGALTVCDGLVRKPRMGGTWPDVFVEAEVSANLPWVPRDSIHLLVLEGNADFHCTTGTA